MAGETFKVTEGLKPGKIPLFMHLSLTELLPILSEPVVEGD